MSHEHRALGFRPPPGSLAAEAQAAAAKHAEANGKPRRNSNDNGRKPRQDSTGANGTAGGLQWRRASESPTKQRRGSNEEAGQPCQAKRRGSNESQKSKRGSTEIKRTSSDQSGAKVNSFAAARASGTTVPSTAVKEELLREAALRDAERIK